MTGFGFDETYRDKMRSFITDPDLIGLTTTYQPYLEMHQLGDVFATFDIVQNFPSKTNVYKLVWNTDYDLPIPLKRDLIALFKRHFAD